MSSPWTIPFDNVNYVCWKDKSNKPHYRKLTDSEERDYFLARNKEQFLNELLSK